MRKSVKVMIVKAGLSVTKAQTYPEKSDMFEIDDGANQKMYLTRKDLRTLKRLIEWILKNVK